MYVVWVKIQQVRETESQDIDYLSKLKQTSFKFSCEWQHEQNKAVISKLQSSNQEHLWAQHDFGVRHSKIPVDGVQHLLAQEVGKAWR